MIACVSERLGISNLEHAGCCYMTFRMERGYEADFMRVMTEQFGDGTLSPHSLVSPKELPAFDKYDEFIPGDLLRHAYATDRLNVEEATKRIRQIAENKTL